MKVLPSAVTDRRIGSPPFLSSESILARGSTTAFPRCRRGVMTMKMMSSTSTTSTSGVTLMSLFTPLPEKSIDMGASSDYLAMAAGSDPWPSFMK
jgi:hypothetical protein